MPTSSSPTTALNDQAHATEATPAQQALAKIVTALDLYHNELARGHNPNATADHLISTLGRAVNMTREKGMTESGGRLENRYNDFMVNDLGGEPHLVLIRQALWEHHRELDWNQNCHRAAAKLISATGKIMQHSRASDVQPLHQERPVI